MVLTVTIDSSKVSQATRFCLDFIGTIQSDDFKASMKDREVDGQTATYNWEHTSLELLPTTCPSLEERDDSTATSADTATASVTWVLPVVIGCIILIVVSVLVYKHRRHAQEEEDYLKHDASNLMQHHVREPAGMPPYLPPPLYSRILMDKRKSGWKPPQAPAYRPPPRYMSRGSYTTTQTSVKLPSYLPPPTYDTAKTLVRPSRQGKADTAKSLSADLGVAEFDAGMKGSDVASSPSIVRLPSKRQPPEARVGLRQPSFIEPSQQPEDSSAPRPSRWSSVQTTEWALSNGTGAWEVFSEALDERGITGDVLLELQDDDLLDMGIDDPEERFVIMDRIRALRA